MSLFSDKYKLDMSKSFDKNLFTDSSTFRTFCSKVSNDFLNAMILLKILSDGFFTVSSSRTLKIGLIMFRWRWNFPITVCKALSKVSISNGTTSGTGICLLGILEVAHSLMTSLCQLTSKAHPFRPLSELWRTWLRLRLKTSTRRALEAALGLPTLPLLLLLLPLPLLPRELDWSWSRIKHLSSQQIILSCCKSMRKKPRLGLGNIAGNRSPSLPKPSSCEIWWLGLCGLIFEVKSNLEIE